ncbi:MAG: type III-A CRISPR-associated protein Csm2 [Methanobacteriota archaeon]|nr:MAG: type III-A CRISPR-associated protein Csm2 [Euryarchaeota archaeon]
MPFFQEDLAQVNPEVINELARKEGEKFARRIKTNQIRNVFSTVEKIRSDFKREKFKVTDEIRRELIMLRPKLAYAVGRNEEVKPFQELFDEAIEKVLESQNPADALKNFFFLAEAVVAYHKYFGGRDN